MNVEKMLQLADLLENLPSKEMFNMESWFCSFRYDEDGELDYDHLDPENVPIIDPKFINDCNTAGCIAGWAMIMDDHIKEYHEGGMYSDLDPYDWPDAAIIGASILGIDDLEASMLFYTQTTKNLWYRYYKEIGGNFVTEFERLLPNGEKAIRLSIDQHAITAKDAAAMLRGLATGLFSFDNPGYAYTLERSGEEMHDGLVYWPEIRKVYDVFQPRG